MADANAMLGYAYELYGVVVAGKPMVRPIRLRFRGRIRDEQKFPSLEALRVQLEKDRDAVSSAVHISPGA